ncbi:MAG: hypothetical protein FWC11_00275 [Firmicutes bacterium]|nr:hypothetical protein [Bacillota bacterium]
MTKMIKHLNIKKILFAIVIIFLTIFAVIPSCNLQTARANSPQTLSAFSERYVMYDLKNDPNFNINDFPFNENGELRVINFIEFGWSHSPFLRGNFGLYIYVYNPRQLNFMPYSSNHAIQMAYEYNADGKPVAYRKFPLRLMNFSTGDFHRLFWKFRVNFSQEDLWQLTSRLEKIHNRRYDISGIELHIMGQQNATEFVVAQTVTFSGFAQGLGPNLNADSTLRHEISELKTIELDVNHTFFRSDAIAPLTRAGYHHQIDSVFFSVPNRILHEFGRLQRIRAEWWEYRTCNILVTSRRSLYNNVLNHGIGRRLETTTQSRTVFNENIGYSLYRDLVITDAFLVFVNSARANWTFNGMVNANFPISRWQHSLHYAFFVDEITEFRRGEPFGGGISSETLADWIFNYNHRFGSLNNQFLSVRERQIPQELFSPNLCRVSTEQGRVAGHQLRDIDADDDTFDLMRFEENQTWWQRFTGSGGDSIRVDERQNISPIFKISNANILNGNRVSVANELLIHYNDVERLRQFNATANAKNETTFLFRFAQTEYFARAITISTGNNIFPWQLREGEAYIAQATVFFDFDIISLTFNHQGEMTVIPVVSSPQDIIPEITPPSEVPPSNNLLNRFLNWLAALLGISREELIFWLILAGVVVAVIAIIVVIVKVAGGKNE